MACKTFSQPVSGFTGNTYVVIRISNNTNTTSLGYRIFLRETLKKAREDNKDIYVVYERVEMLESLIDTDPYIFDDDISPEGHETKIEFLTFKEFKEFIKNHIFS